MFVISDLKFFAIRIPFSKIFLSPFFVGASYLISLGMMKKMLLLPFLVFPLLVWSQSDTIYSGTYELVSNTKNGNIYRYTLFLVNNGTYMFHSVRNEDCAGCEKVQHRYARGNWIIDEENTLSLQTDLSDLNDGHMLNLSNSLARYNAKTAEDSLDGIATATLQFYVSDIPWLQGKELEKKEERP